MCSWHRVHKTETLYFRIVNTKLRFDWTDWKNRCLPWPSQIVFGSSSDKPSTSVFLINAPCPCLLFGELRYVSRSFPSCPLIIRSNSYNFNRSRSSSLWSHARLLTDPIPKRCSSRESIKDYTPRTWIYTGWTILCLLWLVSEFTQRRYWLYR